MLQQRPLEPPKAGRSRFSKALPSVPGLYDNSSVHTPPKDLPPVPSLPNFNSQPSFQPRVDSLSNTNNMSTPSPQVPESKAPSAAAAGGPPTMVVSRKPVARKPVPATVQSPASMPAPAPAPVQKLGPAQTQVSVSSGAGARTDTPAKLQITKAPTPVQPLPSPSESLSSIFSAYSHSTDGYSDENELRSFIGAAGVPHLGANAAAKHDAPSSGSAFDVSTPPSTVVSSGEAPQMQNVARKTVLDQSEAPPPPPPTKDQPPQAPVPPAKEQTSTSKADLTSPSSPRPLIWRRRSFKVTHELASLKLDRSHGSTASTLPVASDEPQASAESKNASLPQAHAQAAGKRTSPASHPATPRELAETEVMGIKASKLGRLRAKALPSQPAEVDANSSTKSRRPRLATNRPPTPEYQQEDAKTPIPYTYVSLVSPASSPEPAKNASSKFSKELPPHPSSPGHFATNAATREEPPRASSATGAKAVPDLKIRIPPSASTPPMPVPGNEMRRTQTPPNIAGSAGRRDSREAHRFPPRESSAKADSMRHASQPRMSTDMDPRLVQSDSQGMLYRGRDGTLYPEMKVSPPPDARACYFPFSSGGSSPDGHVIKAVPLKDSHFGCFQKHRTMKRVPNKHIPLSCQTCEREDQEDRWACGFCHLRICESCVRTFDGCKRDLQRLTDDLNKDTTLSLTSPERPGSALVLQLSS